MFFRFEDRFVLNFCWICGAPIVNAAEAREFRVDGVGRVPFKCATGLRAHDMWVSPRPVSVLALFVDGLVPLGRRGINPCIGELALGAGFLNPGEDPRAATLREAKEEMAFVMPLGERLTFIESLSAPDRPALLECYGFNWLTAEYGPCNLVADGHEVTEIIYAPFRELPPLAFSTHVEFIALAAHKFGLL